MRFPPDPAYFPLFFLGVWLAVTTLLTFLSGWRGLAERYPDDPAQVPLLTLKEQSGSMGLHVSMSRILTLSACPGGLRVSMLRIFGPFNRPFLTPWTSLRVERADGWLGRRAVLLFGDEGRLSVEAHVADALWRAAGARWPETGPVPAPESAGDARRDVARKFLLACAFLWAFFLIVPPLMGGPALYKDPAFLFAIFAFFPAFLALSFVFEYRKRRSTIK